MGAGPNMNGGGAILEMIWSISISSQYSSIEFSTSTRCQDFGLSALDL